MIFPVILSHVSGLASLHFNLNGELDIELELKLSIEIDLDLDYEILTFSLYL